MIKLLHTSGLALSSFAQFIAPGEGRPNRVSIFLWNLGGFMEGKADEMWYDRRVK